MKRWLKWIAVLVVFAAAAGGWMAFSAPVENETPRTVAVSRGSVERTVLATGVIEASSLVSVGAEVSGRIKSLNVQLGDTVKTGDVIAEIDSLNQENAVRAAEAALANIKAQRAMQEASLAQARVELERAEKLNPDKIVSDAALQTAALAVATAEGQLQAVEAQIQQAEISVDTAKLDLDRTRILAPTDGTVVAVAVEVGQSVNANNASPTIVKVANLDNMVVKAEISEADVPRVEPGQSVYFTILGDPETRIDATLRAIEPAPESIADDTSSSSSASAIYYNGLFDVPNPEHKLRISMTAQVTIVLDAAEDVLTLPSAVLAQGSRRGNGYVLSVWNPATETVEPRDVVVGLNNNVSAEIVSGLTEGELVVSATGTVGSGGGSTQRGNFGGGGFVGPGML